MPNPDLPLILDPKALEPLLGGAGLLVIDLSKESLYQQVHVPGAIHLDYPKIVASRKPVHGLLPDSEELDRLFSAIGIGEDTHVVACDDEGGGKAGRLLWTLEVLGHRRYSLLDGGIHAWINEGFPKQAQPVSAQPAGFSPHYNPEVVADSAYILERLDDPGMKLLDSRTPEEYSGSKRYAERGGHIPGAVNWDWTEAMDQQRNLRLKPREQLLAALEGMEITPDKEIVTYCHTHHRSSHTWVVLKHLGFQQVRGYPGSWSDWGNRADTPIA